MNNINRNNYEEYFILHLDNELTAAEKQELVIFLQQNSDLQAELDLLSGTKLSVDETVVFPDKDLLFAGNLLQQTGVEETVSPRDSEIIMYLDAELTQADKQAFEQKLATDTELQQQVALFAKTKLQPQTAVVFPDKALLYKEEETKRRIIPMYWLRMGVAAAVLLTLGVGGFKWLNNPVKVEDNALAGMTPATELPGKEVKGDEGAVKTGGETATVISDQPTETSIVNKQDANSVDYAVTKKQGNTDGNYKTNTGTVSTTAATINDVTNKQPSNNLPVPANKTDFTTTGDAGLAGTSSEIKPLQNNTATNGMMIPALKNNQAVFASNSPHVFDEVVEVEEPENKKNKLRGFLRKVTRNFQKQTSIDMTNGDDQLLVAGFALKM